MTTDSASAWICRTYLLFIRLSSNRNLYSNWVDRRSRMSRGYPNDQNQISQNLQSRNAISPYLVQPKGSLFVWQKPKYPTRELRGDGEVRRARRRSSWRRDLNLAGFRADRNRGCDLAVVDDRERSLHPAERDLGRASETGSINGYGISDLTARRAEAHDHRLNQEFVVALEGASGCSNGHKPSSRARRNRNREIGIRDDSESRRILSVEGNLGRPGETLTEDFRRRTDRARPVD